MPDIAAYGPGSLRSRNILGIGALAGLAGGAIELAWIALFQQLTGAEAATVARGVTATLMPGYASGSAAVPLGIALHMSLALVLGLVLAYFVARALPRIAGTAFEPLAVVLMLVGVWAVNFLVVLPAIKPDFVHIVPLGASLASKTLFGLAAALVFWTARRR
jgi:hypothetical protein